MHNNSTGLEQLFDIEQVVAGFQNKGASRFG
jgi:hypothetical protein